MTEESKIQEILKVSFCNVCNGWVRAAGVSYLSESTKARNEFLKEVMKYNLSVKVVSLEEWRLNTIEHCNCK